MQPLLKGVTFWLLELLLCWLTVQSPSKAKLGKVDVKYSIYENFELLYSNSIDLHGFDSGIWIKCGKQEASACHYTPPMSHHFWVPFKDFLAMCVPVFLKDMYTSHSHFWNLTPHLRLSPSSRNVFHKQCCLTVFGFSRNYHALVDSPCIYTKLRYSLVKNHYWC